MKKLEFKLINIVLFVMLLGVLYLNFFYEETNEFTKVSATSPVTASVH